MADQIARLGASRAVGDVVKQISRKLLDGKLVPGQRLIESDLMDELSVGRGPIREALRILAGDGIVELVPNRGARVRRFTAAEIVEIQEVVAALQFLAADLLMTRRLDEAEIAALYDECTHITDAIETGNKRDIMRSLRQYQHRFNELSRNRYITIAMDGMNHSYLSDILADNVPMDRLVECARSYNDLTESIATGDIDRVHAIMKGNYDTIISCLRED